MVAEFNKAYDAHFGDDKKSTALNKAKRLQRERGLKFGIVQFN